MLADPLASRDCQYLTKRLSQLSSRSKLFALNKILVSHSKAVISKLQSGKITPYPIHIRVINSCPNCLFKSFFIECMASSACTNGLRLFMWSSPLLSIKCQIPSSSLDTSPPFTSKTNSPWVLTTTKSASPKRCFTWCGKFKEWKHTASAPRAVDPDNFLNTFCSALLLVS